MRSNWKYILMASLMAACGSNDSGFDCRQACSHLETCQLKLDRDDCVHDCNVIREVALDQSWVEWGDCMLEETCQEATPESCLNRVAVSAPGRLFELTLDRVCDRVVDCQMGISHITCMNLIKKYGGKRIKQAKLLKKQVLDCVRDCVVETPCSRITDSVEPCLDTCGVVLKTMAPEEDEDE